MPHLLCPACCALNDEPAPARPRGGPAGDDGIPRFVGPCQRCGTVAVRTETVAPLRAPLRFGGHGIDAPGFNPQQFERAVACALIDQLEVEEVAGRYRVGGYRVSRTACDCRAGRAGIPCAHRAALVFRLDVRVPALRRRRATGAAETA